jgi:protein-S-isoprenylcysteine O-methyltransferase Ste14
MIVNPNYWSNGIVTFSKKTYFHWFEIISRLVTGCVFVFYSQVTVYPQLIVSIGYLLIAVGLGLAIIGSVKHRQFAVWSAQKFKRTFRPAGFGSFLFGGFLIYIITVS